MRLTTNMTGIEHAALVAGILILGTTFGGQLFYDLPEFWRSADIWPRQSAFVASFVLGCTIIFSYFLRPGLRILLSLLLLSVAVWLVLGIQELRTIPYFLGDETLTRTEHIQSWSYRLFIYVSIILTLLIHVICAVFALSLVRFIENFKLKPSLFSNKTLLVSASGVLTLLVLSVGSSAFIDHGPIYGSIAFPSSTKRSQRVTYHKMLENHWNSNEKISEIDSFAVSLSTDNSKIQSVADNIYLFKFEPINFYKRGKARMSLIDILRHSIYQPEMELVVYQNTSPPDVPLHSTYKFTDMEYVPKQTLLVKIGIDTDIWLKTVAAKLRLLSDMESGKSLLNEQVYVQGKMLEIGHLGSFQIIKSDLQSDNFPAMNWLPMSTLLTPAKEGIVISIDDIRLYSLGIELAAAEEKIISILQSNKGSLTSAEISDSIFKQQDGLPIIYLKDIASIRGVYLHNPPIEINGEFFKIEVRRSHY